MDTIHLAGYNPYIYVYIVQDALNKTISLFESTFILMVFMQVVKILSFMRISSGKSTSYTRIDCAILDGWEHGGKSDELRHITNPLRL